MPEGKLALLAGKAICWPHLLTSMATTLQPLGAQDWRLNGPWKPYRLPGRVFGGTDAKSCKVPHDGRWAFSRARAVLSSVPGVLAASSPSWLLCGNNDSFAYCSFRLWLYGLAGLVWRGAAPILANSEARIRVARPYLLDSPSGARQYRSMSSRCPKAPGREEAPTVLITGF